MPVPRWTRIAVPVCALAAGGCVLSWAGAAAGVTPSVLPAPQVKVSNAHTDLCPTAAVSKALTDQGVTLEAKSPAIVVDAGGRRCVRLPISKGEFALDLSKGSVPADGGVVLRKAGGRSVSFTDVVFDFGSHRANGTATADGAKAGRARQQSVELFSFAFDAGKTKVDLSKGSAEGAAALSLGTGGYNALQDAFGSSPLPSQGTVFDATAGGDVAQAARALSRALLP
ncbi:hypothetical protein CP973_27505 [Streptomyces albofaciens JCM 4342]|uniref:hypothetical protein n=1 Tax=Streptomyces albofaciens TaxID=66866 RepID=UPI00123ACF20|nr:hypothetical protein [Streptomyces albofaciens]KAA6213050.1 hypothetical protein CP973_27505 [Streptomyces albofaciens JCM 4342]